MKLYLIDYKGKYDIIQDKVYDMDFVVGRISKGEAIEQSSGRKEACDYYGIPAYIGDDEDLNKIYNHD